MKRIILYGSLALILGGILAVLSAGSRLLGSPQGVRWLLGELSQRTDVKIHARSITGGMRKGVRMEGVTIRWPLGEATVKEIRLRCQPLLLPFGQLAVEELSLHGVRIQDNRPDSGKPPELTWPELTGAYTRLNAWIDRLELDDLEYRRPAEPPVAITRFSAAVEWRHFALTATTLELVVPAGQVTGMITAGFGRPTLAANITMTPGAATPVSPAAGFSRFQLRTRLFPGNSPHLLAGPLTLTAFRDSRKVLELTGDILTTRNALNLRGVNLIRTGQRGTIRGDGEVILTPKEPRGRLTLRVSDLDLAAEIGTATNLTGTLTLQGTAIRYAGRFDLDNQGETWRTARLTGSFSGNDQDMIFSGLTGHLLGGRMKGELRLGWKEGIVLTGSLRGDKLDPARMAPEWNGVVNLELQGSATWPKAGPRSVTCSGRLLSSRLRGRPLAGEIFAHAAGDTLRIERLLLAGDGFHLRAAGDPRQQLKVAAKITDLSGVVPGTGGELDLTGWLRHTAGRTAGSFTGHGRELRGGRVRIGSAQLAARVDTTPGFPLEVTARMTKVTCNRLHADHVSLMLQGSPERHTLKLALNSAGAEITVVAAGGYDGRATWLGEITALSGRDRVGPWKLASPAKLTVSPETLSLSPLRLTGIGTGELDLTGRILFAPIRGELRAAWNALDLSRGEEWLSGVRLSGTTSGAIRMESPTGEGVKLATRINAVGVVATADRTVTVRQASLELEGDEKGIRSSLDFATAEGIGLHGRFTSPLPARRQIPQQGLLNATWEGVDLALLRRHLPPDLELSGALSGKMNGNLLPHERLDLTGTATLNDGAARWRSGRGELSAKIGKGDLSWSWRGETLNAAASLTLAEHGKATADVTLPLPARLTTRLDREAPFWGSLKGEFHEKGLLTTLLPGLLQESNGDVAVDLQAKGSWRKPSLTGRLELSKAGAYLPSAGVTLKELRLVASLERDQLTVEQFTISSGGGRVEGNAFVRLAGYKVIGYKGSIKGEKFQVVHLPDFQALASPDITFEGSPEKLTIRGSVRIPELLAKGSDRTTVVRPSSDVIVDRGVRDDGGMKGGPALDIRIRTELGDRVFLKEAGLDAKLEGGVEVTLRDGERLKGSGEIRVAKGRYSSYGVTLDVKQGRAVFAGGSVEQPTLDILALREIGDVKAGVTVRGTPGAPVVRLYSDPAMPDVDILSLVVLGRKLNDSEEKSDLLMKATSFLASRGESIYLQEQIKSRLGIDTFEVTTAKQQTSNYTKIESSLLDTGQKSATGSIAESTLQVGKYLTPKLYFSYGWSLFNDSHVFTVRYNLTKQWEIETRGSTEATGGDIFYRIEFD